MRQFAGLTALGAALCAAAAAHAQIAPGVYVGSVQFNNVCSNGNQGFYALPVRLAVSSKGALTYLETDITTQNGGAVPLPQGGMSIVEVDPNGHWTGQDAIYDSSYNGYHTDSGTWTQTFTNNTNSYSSTGTFDIVVNGTVVCSEPTNGTFLRAPNGY